MSEARSEPSAAVRSTALPAGDGSPLASVQQNTRAPVPVGPASRSVAPRARALAAAALAVACLLPAAGCSDGAGGTGPGEPVELAADRIATGLTQPVHLTAPPGGTRLFVAERGGTIRIVEGGQVQPGSFLDLSGEVSTGGGEQGLLSLAFHPDFDVNGRFYVDFTNADGDTRVVGYEVDPADPDRADPATADTLLRVDQPFSNHNGGLLTFGPDGMLYVGLGDGGSGGDPIGHGQDSTTLLGSILRLDVDGGDPYTIPDDNPFAGSGPGRGEIWAYGLRNPWRFAFDREADRLFVADVGQNAWEEVNAVPSARGGVNYGWNVMEGTHCFDTSDCDPAGLTLPVVEYSHSEGCSVTGGHPYRGDALPELQGHYFYSDFCEGWLRSFRLDAGGTVVERREWSVGSLGRVTSFGRDPDGELYVLSSQGDVYRLRRGGG